MANVNAPRRGSTRGPAASATPAVLKPFKWYVDWVRANEENAQSLERLSRSFAMILGDANDLVSMECCWAGTKMHTAVNQAIIQTGYRAATPSEILTHILRAVQELESLGELLLRKYCGHQTAWDVILALQSVKCVLNACVHRHLFMMPWVWRSVQLYLRQVARALWLPRHLSAASWPFRKPAAVAGGGSSGSGSGRDGGGEGRNVVRNCVHGDTVGPNGTRLVIPRVVSERHGEHTHYYDPTETAATSRRGDAALAREEAEAVPFTLVDILGMVVDAFLLVRPVLVVAMARRSFPRHGRENVAIVPPPHPPAASTTTTTAAAEEVEEGGEGRKKGADANDAKTAAAEDSFRVLHATMAATRAEQTLFSSWKWWGIFACLDAVVVLVSRFIRARRIPVVYLSSPPASQRLLEGAADDNGGETEGEEEEVEAEAEAEAAPATIRATDDAPPRVVTEEPAVVSRDALRLQHAMRNMSATFLRDPFFTIVLKQPICAHFINGFVNRIPLLGSILAYQVGYFLSMQHYSFLYSVGQ